MFKKYVYTCPDVIHMRKVQRRWVYGSLAANVIYIGGLMSLVAYADHKEKQKYKNVEVHETETD